MSPSPAPLVILATATARPGMEGDLEQALLEVVEPTLAQPGCLGFELLQSPDRTAITGIERWASDEAHNHHLQGDHVTKLMARFEGILAAPPVILPMRPLSR